MFQGKPSRFRRRPSGRNQRPHGSGSLQRSNPFTNGQPRNNFRPTLSAEKSLEKYTTLAKEAMSSGDKTLSENYLQHADHFTRVIDDRNRNRVQTKINVVTKSTEENKNLSEAKIVSPIETEKK